MEDDFLGTKSMLIATDLKNQSTCVLNSDYHLSISKLVHAVCDWNSPMRSISNLLSQNIVNKKTDSDIGNCFVFYYNNLKDLGNEALLQIRDTILTINYIEIIAKTEEDSYTISLVSTKKS